MSKLIIIKTFSEGKGPDEKIEENKDNYNEGNENEC